MTLTPTPRRALEQAKAALPHLPQPPPRRDRAAQCERGGQALLVSLAILEDSRRAHELRASEQGAVSPVVPLRVHGERGGPTGRAVGAGLALYSQNSLTLSDASVTTRVVLLPFERSGRGSVV
jgi:hypothetical protein